VPYGKLSGNGAARKWGERLNGEEWKTYDSRPEEIEWRI
jgi:hypothetical protein